MSGPKSRRVAEGLRKSLSEAASYRDFLRLYFVQTGCSYAEVARRAGFSSRSYPRDVTEGRRRLTVRSLPTLIRGLRIEPRLAELFQVLYYVEYPEEFGARAGGSLHRPVSEVRQRLQEKLERARQRARGGTVRANRAEPRQLASAPADLREEVILHLFGILAALGNPGTGATLEELSRLTGLAKPAIAPVLAVCEAEGLIRHDGDQNRYLPGAGHLNLTGLRKSELIRSIFLRSLDRVRQAADRSYDSDEALFYVSAISVARADLPALKKELRELLLRFTDERGESTPKPDTVIHVVGSMFESRGLL